jgi:hypothetical protein
VSPILLKAKVVFVLDEMAEGGLRRSPVKYFHNLRRYRFPTISHDVSHWLVRWNFSNDLASCTLD